MAATVEQMTTAFQQMVEVQKATFEMQTKLLEKLAEGRGGGGGGKGGGGKKGERPDAKKNLEEKHSISSGSSRVGRRNGTSGRQTSRCWWRPGA